MGNQVGVDVSGSLIRVACLCFPRNADLPFVNLGARWGAVETFDTVTALQRYYNPGEHNGWAQEAAGDQKNSISSSVVEYEDVVWTSQQRVSSSASSPSQNHQNASPLRDPKANARDTPDSHSEEHEHDRNPSQQGGGGLLHEKLSQAAIRSDCLSSHRHMVPVLYYDDRPVSSQHDSLLLSHDGAPSHHPYHHDHPSGQSSQQHRPYLSQCQNRRIFHSYATPEEKRIRSYLEVAPLWNPPRIFCFDLCGPSPGKAFSFVIDASDSEEALTEALPYIEGSYLQLTGSGAAALRDLIFMKFPSINLRLQFHREISCILEAVDFLVHEVPEACFRYLRTHRPLNSTLLPDDKSYTAILLEKKDLNNFYPYLLVNLKAGVSFHRVTSSTESERVGGSTIGGATFMGLIRLLCHSITSPLDAFLLAQSGDNSTTDMFVEDIYGGDYPAIGLKGTIIASTFGKLQNDCPKLLTPANLCPKKWVKQNHQRREKRSEEEDLSFDSSTTMIVANEQQAQNNSTKKVMIQQQAKEEEEESVPATGQPSSSANPIDVSSPSESQLMVPSGDPSAQRPLFAFPCLELEDNAGPSKAGRPHAVSSCDDRLCCCCGRQKWAPCEATEASAAADVGILEGDPGSHELPSPVSDSWCKQSIQSQSCDGSERCSENPFHPDVALAASHGVVDEESLQRKCRTLSSGQRQPTEADVARSILTMTSFNVAQQAYLNAVIHSCSRIVLVGYYLEMPGFLSSIQHCIDFWSGGTCEITFIRLATNLGALGASLRARQRASSAYI